MGQKPGALEVNDELAKNLGLESAEKLREIVRGQIESQYGNVTRQKVKRQILDALDEAYKFEAPSKLVEAEFNNIWAQVNNDLAQAGRTFADEDTTEEAAQASRSVSSVDCSSPAMNRGMASRSPSAAKARTARA